MKRVLLIVVLLCVGRVWAWDVEHDVVAELTARHLPEPIRSRMGFDEALTIVEYCHFPDMTEESPRRFHDLDDLEALVGAEDRAIIVARGFHEMWLHTEVGKATVMSLLARAFGRGDFRRAAFYISVLTHAVSDESALNHPTILNFIQYCGYQGVSFGARKVEPGAKNVFGFRSDGGVVRRVRDRLRGYEPSVPAGVGFRACQLELCSRVVAESAYAAEKEVSIAFAKGGGAEDALADLVAMQVRAILDIVMTCWTHRAPDAVLPYDDFRDRFDRRTADLVRDLDPGRQAVFADLYDASLDPAAPKATVALVCESLGLRATGAQSYAGRLTLAAAGRTLRRLGYAVKPCNLRTLRSGGLSVAETPVLVMTAGNEPPPAEAAAALIGYRRAGGRLVYICGQNPTSAHERAARGVPLVVGHGDPMDITGFGPLLVDRRSEELPVSPDWQQTGACADWRRMVVEVGAVRQPLRRDANEGGHAKPVCAEEIRPGDGVQPLAYLDNGTSRFCVAASRGNVVWLPVYLLSPFLFSDETEHDLGALTLSAFSTDLLSEGLSRILGAGPTSP